MQAAALAIYLLYTPASQYLNDAGAARSSRRRPRAPRRVACRRHPAASVHADQPGDEHAAAGAASPPPRAAPPTPRRPRRNRAVVHRRQPGGGRARDDGGPRAHHRVRVLRRRLALRRPVEPVRRAVRAARQLRDRRAGHQRRGRELRRLGRGDPPSDMRRAGPPSRSGRARRRWPRRATTTRGSSGPGRPGCG